jgi:hypothetical protein
MLGMPGQAVERLPGLQTCVLRRRHSILEERLDGDVDQFFRKRPESWLILNLYLYGALVLHTQTKCLKTRLPHS